MTQTFAATRYPTPHLLRALNLTAKAGLVLMLATALLAPELGHMEDKAAGVRAIAYPMLSFAVPAIWWCFWRERASFPWLADFLITLTCFTDILGNRLDLYDQIVWFDDWMHFVNTGLLAAAWVLLTLHRSATLAATLERALAFGATAAIFWEIGEYFAFISSHTEKRMAYVDTLGDLGLGVMGVAVAAFTVHACWRNGLLASAAPQLEWSRDQQQSPMS
ncbi:hypothetical protein [Nocardioides daejeonensis]|uniref:hypothetical protein n=1 Tax=Nocardioides daejeonensis TaxID=1046556 RepID=UPI000D74DA09|nr:hypothetical protein [Nocardioides daejeonensis]